MTAMASMMSIPTPASSSGHAAAIVACLAAPPEDVGGVVDRLDELQVVLDAGPCGPRDGLACFNDLHQQVTADVLTRLGESDGVRDPEFLARLDVELAHRYFAAVSARAGGGRVPRSWAVVFDRCDDTGPLTALVCGLNAQVNHDLALAVVRACTVLGRSGPGPVEQADHRLLHVVLAHHTGRLRELLHDRLGHPIDDAELDVLLDGPGGLPAVTDRDAAWRRAEHLWTLRTRPAEYERECDAIDWRAAMMGRGVLSIASSDACPPSGAGGRHVL